MAATQYGQLQIAASSGTNSDGFGIVVHGTDDGGWRDSSGFEEEKLNAVWTHAQGGGQWKLSLAGSNLNQETAGFIVGQNAYRDPAIARSNPDPDAYRNAQSLRFAAQYRGASGIERAPLPAQLAHGFPPAFPARPAGREQRPGQRRRDAVGDAAARGR